MLANNRTVQFPAIGTACDDTNELKEIDNEEGKCFHFSFSLILFTLFSSVLFKLQKNITFSIMILNVCD